MLNLKILLCSFLIISNIYCVFIKQFLYKDEAPRCCDEGEVLLGTDIKQLSYNNCVPDDNGISYILTNEITLNLTWYNAFEENYCINDIVATDIETRKIGKIYVDSTRNVNLDLVSFPKCCPVYFAYDIIDHKCKPTGYETMEGFVSFDEEFLYEYLPEGLFYIKPGLSDCNKVIADYQLDFFESTLIDEERGLYLESINKIIPYGSYCLDKVYNSDKYVVKICHTDFEVCKRSYNDNRIRCIRKCCPDGMMYKNGTKCRHDFTKGLQFDDKNRMENYHGGD